MITLVTGAAGQLGRAIVRAAAPEGQVVALPRVDLDVTVQADVQEAVLPAALRWWSTVLAG